MKIKIFTTILLVLSMSMNVDAQTRRATTAKKTARTTATTKKSPVKKAAATQSPMETLTALLEKKGNVSVKSIADLNDALAWAKTVEEKVGDKIKAGPRKLPNGNYAVNGSYRALSCKTDRYYDVINELGTHIGNSRKYTQSGRATVQGAQIHATFIDFLLLQHINDILDLLPDEACKDAFKTTMVSMYELMDDFFEYSMGVQHRLGFIGQGSGASQMEIARYESIATGTNDFLSQLWENINGDGSTCFSEPKENFDNLLTLLNYALSDEGVIPDSIEGKQNLVKSADQFITSYNNWLQTYPNHRSKVDSSIGALFNNWYKNAQSDLEESGVDVQSLIKKIEEANWVYSWTSVDQTPSFIGGDMAMYQWLGQNMVYPQAAADDGAQGRVTVQFIVEKDGSISHVKIARGRHPALEEEAVRIISEMPRWNPGRKNGQPVRVSHMLPINFTMQ